MILNPTSKKVLCFGDSLTWGNYYGENRFALKDRWTYMLQELLGDKFDVVEEGLCSRTVDMDYDDQLDRNGLPYFRACFETHDPVEYLVFMLGSNDVKARFNKTADQIAESISSTLDWINTYQNVDGVKTKIILMSPPQISLQYLRKTSSFNTDSNNKLIELAGHLKKLSEDKGYMFLDWSQKLKGNDKDGVHLDIESHKIIARELSGLIR